MANFHPRPQLRMETQPNFKKLVIITPVDICNHRKVVEFYSEGTFLLAALCLVHRRGCREGFKVAVDTLGDLWNNAPLGHKLETDHLQLGHPGEGV